MFVKHIVDQDVFNNGFLLNPLFNESFSREKIDTKFLSTYMQIWVDVNAYNYKVTTDREGEIARGTIFSADALNDLVDTYFNNDKKNFIRRNIKSRMPEWDPIQRSCFLGSLEGFSIEKIEHTITNLFGESYVEEA